MDFLHRTFAAFLKPQLKSRREQSLRARRRLERLLKHADGRLRQARLPKPPRHQSCGGGRSSSRNVPGARPCEGRIVMSVHSVLSVLSHARVPVSRSPCSLRVCCSWSLQGLTETAVLNRQTSPCDLTQEAHFLGLHGRLMAAVRGQADLLLQKIAQSLSAASLFLDRTLQSCS